MVFVYPAVFHETKEGKYEGSFPDLEGCYGKGDTLEDAIEDANAALYDWIYVELTEFEGVLPGRSEADDLQLKEGEILRNISVNIRFTDGWDE